MHNSTTEKEQKNGFVMPSKKSVKVSFVTLGMGKMGKKGRQFLVCVPVRQKDATPSRTIQSLVFQVHK